MSVFYITLKRFTYVFFILYSPAAYTQNNAIDSLKKILQTQKEDTNKVNTLNKIGRIYMDKDDHKNALLYSHEALSLSKKTNFKNAEAYAYQNIGNCYHYILHNEDEARKNYFPALKIWKAIRNNNGIISASITLGDTYKVQYNYAEALKNWQATLKLLEDLGDRKGMVKAYQYIGLFHELEQNYPEDLRIDYMNLKLCEELGDKAGIIDALHCIANINDIQHNIPAALKNYFASLQIAMELKDSVRLGITYNCIATMYNEQGKNADALEKSFAALKIYTQPGMPAWGVPFSNMTIGSGYEGQGDSAAAIASKTNAFKRFSEAEKYYLAGLKGWQQIGREDGITHAYFCLGNINIKLKNFPAAKDYLQKSLALSTVSKQTIMTMQSCEAFSKLDSAQGNYQQAYEHYKKYILYRDSLNNEETAKKSLQTRLQYEFDKKEAVNKADRDKKEAITNAARDKRELMIIIGIAVLFAPFILWYRHYRIKKLLELEKLRSGIAADFHDELGSTLSSIALSSEMALWGDLDNTQKTKDILSGIGISARGTVVAMHDMIWTIQPRNDNMDELLLRIREFAFPLAELKNIQLTFDIGESVKNVQPSMDIRKNIYLVFKEALNNAVKYSGASQISIKLFKQQNLLHLEISDNGVGFSRTNGNAGNGLKNMHKRAEHSNGKLIIESGCGKGTKILFSSPVK